MCKLEVGDKVLLKCTAFKGKHKIQDKWKNTIYEVVEQPLSKLPVFKIQSTEGDDTKVVPRNLLLPLFYDPSDQTSEQDSKLWLIKLWVPRRYLWQVQLSVMCIT